MINAQVEVPWVVMPSSVAVGYQCFRGSFCFHLQDEVTVSGKKRIGMECKKGREGKGREGGVLATSVTSGTRAGSKLFNLTTCHRY
jgi:hypothetical protein